MLDPSQTFTVANMLVLPAWVALAASLFIPGSRRWIWRVTGLAVPAALAVAYVPLIVAGFAEAPAGGFGTISEVRTLFASDAALTAGWLHYLAFDLLVGTLIASCGTRAGIPPLPLLLCLPLTFLAGPVGFLLFQILRLGRRTLRGSIQQ